MHHHDKALLVQNMLGTRRKELGFTQEFLGKLLHLSDDAIGKYERGQSAPNLSSAIGFELIFGQRLAELYPGLVRNLADRMIPALQKISVAIEWDESAPASLNAAIRAIGDRLSSLTPDA